MMMNELGTVCSRPQVVAPQWRMWGRDTDTIQTEVVSNPSWSTSLMPQSHGIPIKALKVRRFERQVSRIEPECYIHYDFQRSKLRPERFYEQVSKKSTSRRLVKYLEMRETRSKDDYLQQQDAKLNSMIHTKSSRKRNECMTGVSGPFRHGFCPRWLHHLEQKKKERKKKNPE
jgi:hypothetical protein